MWFKLVSTVAILSSELATCLSVHSLSDRSSQDTFYDIALTSNRANNLDYPVVRLEIGAEEFPIGLAISLHSNDTWIFRSSSDVCFTKENCPVLELGTQGEPWNYTGQDGLKLSGSKYSFSSVAPIIPKGNQWKLDNLTIDVSMTEEGIEGLGDYVDGILGLGPASTFIRQLTGSSEHRFSFFLGREYGTFVIDGFYKNQAWGKYARLATGIGGTFPLNVRRLSLDFEDRTWLQDTKAIIDPTSPDIVIPKSQLIGGVGMGWTLTNNSKIKFGQDMQEQGRGPSLVFDIGDNVTIVVREESYISNNQPALSIGDGDQIILGRPFLHSAYLVVDYSRTIYYVAQANAILPTTDQPSDMRDFNEQGQTEYLSTENPSGPATGSATIEENVGSEQSSSHMKTGVIVGGTLGGIAFLACLLGIFFWCRRRTSRLPRTYMGPPKRLTDLSLYSTQSEVYSTQSEVYSTQSEVYSTQSEVMPPPYSPPSHTEEDIHLMGGYAYAVHQLEPPGGSTVYIPHSAQYNAYYAPQTLHRNQDLIRSESNATAITDSGVPEDMDSQHCPRLPIYNTSASQGPAL